MSKKNGDTAPKPDPQRRIRKIGEREEIIDKKLTQRDIDNMHQEIMVLLDDEERIKEKAKEAAGNFSSQLKTAELQRNELRRQVKSGVRRETLLVEEHLTASNEVIRIRKDTGEQIGQRTATQRELQEELPLEPPAEPDQEFGDEPGDDFAGDPA